HVARALAQARKQLQHPVHGPGLPDAGVANRAKRGKVLAHGKVGKALPPFGHDGQAGARDAVGGPAADIASGELYGAGAQWQLAEQRAQQGSLAHAIAAQQADHLPGAHLQIDTEQHLAGAIAALHALHRQHVARSVEVASSPKYACRTAGSARISAGVPVAIMRPYTSTEMRSASRNTACMSCSTSNMAACPRNDSIRSVRRSVSSG